MISFTCINRNILECKLVSLVFRPRSNKVLIETYWNVNERKTMLFVHGIAVLIETYWNVNEEECNFDYATF